MQDGIFIRKEFRSLSGAYDGAEVAAGLDKYAKEYGINNSIEYVAEKGLFTRPDYSPIDSVLIMFVLDFFVYLRKCSQHDKIINNIREAKTKLKNR